MNTTTTPVRITVRELRETDTIVAHPDATPVHDVRETDLAITRQRYGITFLATWVVDGTPQSRRRGCLRYTDTVWVER